MIKIAYLLFITVILISCSKQNSLYYNIEDFGAKGDSLTLNTEFIQKAIDAAAENGGGVVFIPNGVFVSGSIFLKDNITLELASGAKILGSENIEDYTEMTWGHNKDRQPYHLIIAKDVKNVEIKGNGVIDGNGEKFWKEYEKDESGNMVVPRWISAKDKKVSPLIEITNSQNVDINDIEVRTGGGWNIHLHDCDNVKISGVDIINNLYSPNSDGIDITGSRDVIISDCYIKTCDDAICLKTTPDSRSCHRVTVTNCIMETLCVGLKLGCNESFKDITDVTFSNCVVNKSSRAFGLYVREGGTFENITINNITANTNAALIFNRPIQIMVERRDSNSNKYGIIRNVFISNFICETEGRILLTAEEGCTIENVLMRDICLKYPFIEDPRPYVEESGSGQFPKKHLHPEVGGALGVIVAENVKNLIIDNFITQWPKNDSVPEKWKYPERIENGTQRIHKVDYSKAKQTELSFLWGNKLEGGYINAPFASPSSSSVKKYNLKNSNIKIIQ